MHTIFMFIFVVFFHNVFHSNHLQLQGRDDLVFFLLRLWRCRWKKIAKRENDLFNKWINWYFISSSGWANEIANWTNQIEIHILLTFELLLNRCRVIESTIFRIGQHSNVQKGRTHPLHCIINVSNCSVCDFTIQVSGQLSMQMRFQRHSSGDEIFVLWLRPERNKKRSKIFQSNCETPQRRQREENEKVNDETM